MALLKFGKSKKKSTVRPGRFIVIDGTDGSGKATQTGLLVDELKLAGYDVAMTDFPQYGTKSAGLIEEYLNGKYGQVGPQAASVFYAIDRFDASFKIREWLEQGKIVISNRYVIATYFCHSQTGFKHYPSRSGGHGSKISGSKIFRRPKIR